ncbi:MAG: Fic family protein [Dehalococcoidia bacterium]
MPKYQSWIRREVTIERVAATTRIEGADLDDEAVSNLKKRAPTGRPSESEQANIDAIAAYEFIDYLSEVPDLPIDELVIREINREFLRGAPSGKMPGQYRTGQNHEGPYTPPNQADVPPLMRGFGRWLAKGDEDMHPVVRAGLAHVHLVAIHPFWDGNGRTARGLATLILQRSPFNFRNLLSLERMIEITKTEYFSTIERTLGMHFSRKYDATYWLEFFGRIIAAEAGRLEVKLTDWHRQIEQVQNGLLDEGLNHRQVDGVIYAARAGQITRPDYIEITGASGPTASRDLADLATKGWLIPKGKTRSRVYHYPKDEDEQQLRLFKASARRETSD